MKKKPKVASFESFKNLSTLLKPLKTPAFKKSPESHQNIQISEILLKVIQKEKTPCFLFPAVLEFIDKVNEVIKPSDFTFSHFEFWLNQFSGLSEDENYLVRSKISGKNIPRDQYQILFPIGSGKRFAGSHYVTAHGSPDLDTTIASFWGWMDAFSARVSEGLHIWNVPPGGVLSSLEAAPLTDAFGKNLFKHASQNRSSLSPMGIDFTTQNTLVKRELQDSTIEPTDQERHKHAVMVVDTKGFFVGDIRNEDYESIRQIIRLVTNTLKWFENALHTEFIDLFTKKAVSLKAVSEILYSVFDKKTLESVTPHEITKQLKEQVKQYLIKILGLKNGFQSSFKEFADALKKLKIKKLSELESKLVQSFKKNHVFNAKGALNDKRENIFKAFKEISIGINEAIAEMDQFMDTMDIAIQIKRKVFEFPSRYVTPKASLEEILNKINSFNHVSVVYPNKDNTFWPLGIIQSSSIRSKSLGTVSVRDFCNRSEVNISSDLEVISALDHHKADLKTSTPPLAFIGDVQSCNILVAELAFKINDAYNKGFSSQKETEKCLKDFGSKTLTPSLMRIKNKLIKKALACHQNSSYFIHPQREHFEYLSFIHAIIDDTDLFSKATKRDVLCVAELLNRLKSIEEKKDIEVIDFDKIKEEKSFVKEAVKTIVTNKDMYSIYKEIFDKREKAIELVIQNTSSGASMEIFSDTKEQNGCCRISQTKLFSRNIKSVQTHYEKLLLRWLEKAEEVYKNHELLDLHIHMMSTIPSAEDVYKGGKNSYKHRDYLWIWIPDSHQAIHHLTSFLNAFKGLVSEKPNHMQYQVFNNSPVDYEGLIRHHFTAAPSKEKLMIKKKMPVIILSFDPGTLNSRKAQITPCLPVLVK